MQYIMYKVLFGHQTEQYIAILYMEYRIYHIIQFLIVFHNSLENSLPNKMTVPLMYF
jgi:hypothetical protein